MPADRPFRFGLTVHHAGDADEWRRMCAEAEDQGYASILAADHFNDQWALMPALAAAVAATTRARVSAFVACNDYRHPVMYAKELATLDVFSGGRVDWAIGAGWLSPEYEETGIPFDPGPVRVSRLIEAVGIMKGLFADGPVSFAGEHYRVEAHEGTPKPVQRPHPPLLIGGAGRRLLSFAAREADIVGVAPSWASNAALYGANRTPAPDAADEQLDWIRGAAGERFAAVELNMAAFPVAVTDDRAARAADVAASAQISPDEVLASPHILIGSADEICEALQERRARWGVSYWAIPAAQRKRFAPVVERLAGN
jgi:probable F420-dependent oxidoreductase